MSRAQGIIDNIYLMRLLSASILAAIAAASLFAQDQPLTSLPYTPSLDVDFMDKTVDPCVDFYQYACGNWNKVNPIPSDEDRWSVYSKLTNDNLRYLWGLLIAARKGESRTANEQKIGDYFAACMNTNSVEGTGAKPLADGLKRISSLERKHDIAIYVAWQHTEGIDRNVLFNFASGQEFKDASRVIAFVNAGGLGLPDRDYYTDSGARFVDIRKHYLEHVRKVLQLIGESTPDATADAQTVLDIETELAKASLTRVEKRDPYKLDHEMDATAVLGMTPNFDWDAYLTGVNRPEVKTFNVTEPRFFAELNDLLEKRQLAEWRAYLRWHLVNSHARYLASPFEQEYFSFYSKFLRGIVQEPPRWKTCTRLVDHDLGEALGQVFVAKTFPPAMKQQALQMTKQIEQEMGDDIHQISWMSEPTKEQALAKLHTIVNKIGYPDKWRDYSQVSILPADFARDVVQAQSFEARRDLAKIGKPFDRGEWDMTPPTVNAYYEAQTNEINFPAGVLQPPLYDPKLDDAPNYGNTGATIGHELTHGFDDEGRQFDAQGNLRDWWTPTDAKAFEERVACVRAQYRQYTVIDDVKIKSELTSGEDVADLGGTLLAYLAWKHATAGKELASADGFTPEQRFFIGMAQWACGDQRPESKRMHAVIDPHSPDQFRINGVVSDLPQFQQAFSCKAGQPMVSAHACRVW
jgi:endothelin-converting enzyme/putative endopeptidase